MGSPIGCCVFAFGSISQDFRLKSLSPNNCAFPLPVRIKLPISGKFLVRLIHCDDRVIFIFLDAHFSCAVQVVDRTYPCIHAGRIVSQCHRHLRIVAIHLERQYRFACDVHRFVPEILPILECAQNFKKVDCDFTRVPQEFGFPARIAGDPLQCARIG